jgi:PAS domain S-box-containing protein
VKWLHWSNLPVQVKLVLVITIIATLSTLGAILLTLQRMQQSLREGVERQADFMLDTLELLAVDTATGLPAEDVSDVLEWLLRQNRALLSAGIYDASGQSVIRLSGADADALIPPFTTDGAVPEEGDTTWFIWGSRALLAGKNTPVYAGTRGSVRIGLSAASLQENVAKARNQGITLALAILLVGLLLATMLGRTIVGPLRQSIGAAEWIAGEDLMQRLTATGGDEAAALGYAMERMRAELKELYEGLENQVADRTRELRDSEERFRRVVSSISDVVYMAEASGELEWHYAFISPNVKTLSGYQTQEFMDDAHLWTALVHPNDRDIYASHRQLFAAGQGSEVEYRILNAEGEVVWVRDNGRVERTASQLGFVTYGVISNITERQQAAAELERLLLSEREQRLLAETLAEVTLALTSQTSLEMLLDDILRQAKRIVPYAIATISLLEGDSLFVVRWRSDEESVEAQVTKNMTTPLVDFPDGVDILRSREPIVIVDTREDTAWSPAQGREWVRSYLAMPICQYDRVLGLLHLDGELPGKFTPQDARRLQPLANAAAIAIENARLVADLGDVVAERTADILTEQERSETILRNVNDAIVMSGLDQRIQYVNRAFSELTGYQSNEVLGSPAEVVGAAAGSFDAVGEALSKGRLWQGEVIARRKDGRSYDAALTVAPVLSAEGKMVGSVASHRDISDSKALERVRGRFMTNVSHQLRTPVTNIKLYVDLLKRGGLPQKSTGYLKVLLEQTNRLESLVQDILELTSLDSGQVAKVSKEMALATMLNTVLARFRGRAEESNLQLKLNELPPDLPPVTGDEIWLSRALGELIDNAINFTPPGGEVTLSAEKRQKDDENWVAITVGDTGPGISLDEQKSIFDRFYRGSLADAGDIPGTGLGLSIVTEIMRAHGGEVTLESEKDRGASFTVWLPAS